MDITINENEKYTIIDVNHERVDTLIAPELKSELLRLYQSGTKHLIINMEKVKYIDSNGLSAILVGRRTFSEAGTFVLFGINEHVKKLISISQLDKILIIVATKEEAVDYVIMNAIEQELKNESNTKNS